MKMLRNRVSGILCIFAVCALLISANTDGDWLLRVPERERARENPFARDLEAPQAGAKMFRLHCASCHGANAEGKDRHPNLHSDNVRNALPGELQWLLTNGSLKRGMPSWSRLPEQQRWQLVTYLKTLK